MIKLANESKNNSKKDNKSQIIYKTPHSSFVFVSSRYLLARAMIYLIFFFLCYVDISKAFFACLKDSSIPLGILHGLWHPPFSRVRNIFSFLKPILILRIHSGLCFLIPFIHSGFFLFILLIFYYILHLMP